MKATIRLPNVYQLINVIMLIKHSASVLSAVVHLIKIWFMVHSVVRIPWIAFSCHWQWTSSAMFNETITHRVFSCIHVAWGLFACIALAQVHSISLINSIRIECHTGDASNGQVTGQFDIIWENHWGVFYWNDTLWHSATFILLKERQSVNDTEN